MQWDERPHRGRVLGLLCGMYLAPPAAVVVYLLAAPWVTSVEWWGAGLAVAVLVGVAVGLTCLAGMPDPVAVRVALALLYVPAAISGLLVLWILAEALVYGSGQGR